jgi:hypothetical protein
MKKRRSHEASPGILTVSNRIESHGSELEIGLESSKVSKGLKVLESVKLTQFRSQWTTATAWPFGLFMILLRHFGHCQQIWE